MKNYEENAAYTRVAKTSINAQVSEIVNFTSKLAVFFFIAYLKGNSTIKENFSRKFFHRNKKKLIFWLQNWGSTYTRDRLIDR